MELVLNIPLISYFINCCFLYSAGFWENQLVHLVSFKKAVCYKI